MHLHNLLFLICSSLFLEASQPQDLTVCPPVPEIGALLENCFSKYTLAHRHKHIWENRQKSVNKTNNKQTHHWL